MERRSLLIFLHGIGARSQSFRPLIDQLEDLKEKFEFAVMDLFGFGGTPVPDSIKNVSVKTFAEQTVQEIRRRDPNQSRTVHLIGHSMGGAIAVEIHRLFPELKIGSFVNLEGILQPEDCTVTKEVSEQDRGEFCRSGFEALKENVLALAQSRDVAAQDWILGLEKTTARVFYDISADLVSASMYLYPIYRDWDTHTVYVFGEKTLENSKATYERLRKDGKNVVVIPNAGHVMQLEQPQATAKTIRKHLNNCQAQARFQV